MKKDTRLKIYFAYSGRDREGNNTVQKAIDYLTQPGKDSQVLAEDIKHPLKKTRNNGQPYTENHVFAQPPENGDNKKKGILTGLRTMFRRRLFVRRLYQFLGWALGDWFIRKKIGWSTETEDWRVEAEKLIEESDILVFLYSENSRDQEKTKNIQWEIETAKKLDRNVVLCGLDETEQSRPPEWVEKVDRNALDFVYTQKELREKIESHDIKKYNYTNEDLHDLAKGSDSVSERMFEQYKMYKEEAENLVKTRQTSSNYFMLMNGALLTLIGVALEPEQAHEIIAFILAVASFAGIIISQSWANTVNHYKDLHTAKERLINAIEESLPLQLNSTEYYEVMKDPLNKGRYKSFGETMFLNYIHAGWGVLFLTSSPVFLYFSAVFLWKLCWIRICFCVLLTFGLLKIIAGFMRRLRTRSHTHT